MKHLKYLTSGLLVFVLLFVNVATILLILGSLIFSYGKQIVIGATLLVVLRVSYDIGKGILYEYKE